jgi:hypothetical protein
MKFWVSYFRGELVIFFAGKATIYRLKENCRFHGKWRIHLLKANGDSFGVVWRLFLLMKLTRFCGKRKLLCAFYFIYELLWVFISFYN